MGSSVCACPSRFPMTFSQSAPHSMHLSQSALSTRTCARLGLLADANARLPSSYKLSSLLIRVHMCTRNNRHVTKNPAERHQTHPPSENCNTPISLKHRLKSCPLSELGGLTLASSPPSNPHSLITCPPHSLSKAPLSLSSARTLFHFKRILFPRSLSLSRPRSRGVRTLCLSVCLSVCVGVGVGAFLPSLLSFVQVLASAEFWGLEQATGRKYCPSKPARFPQRPLQGGVLWVRESARREGSAKAYRLTMFVSVRIW